MRTFEIPAAGGIQVSEYSDQYASFFQQQQEIFMYSDEQSLIQQLDFLLSLSSKENLEYRNAARKRCLSSDYSYQNRAQQLYKDLCALNTTK
jgi:spore maturation protein CgeB